MLSILTVLLPHIGSVYFILWLRVTVTCNCAAALCFDVVHSTAFTANIIGCSEWISKRLHETIDSHSVEMNLQI